MLKKIVGILSAFLIVSGAFLMVCIAEPAVLDKLTKTEAAESAETEKYVQIDRVVQSETLRETESESETQTEEETQASEESTEAPEEEQVVLISVNEVTGKNGYEPVQESAEQIEGDAARQIINNSDVGETGDNLSRDAEYYPYYAMLSENSQKIYRQIYANAQALNPVFTPAAEIYTDELKTVFDAVYNDNPELFWLETSYGCKYTSDGKCAEITIKFNQTANNLQAAKTQFEAKSNSIVSEAAKLGSDYEKERYIHDALIAQVEYKDTAMDQSAYSALVNGQSVCSGYSRALQYMLQQVGIPAYYCTGYAKESHAWNIVKLDGEFYNVDATWNDDNPEAYLYFNKTDAYFADSHTRRDLSVYLPACNGEKYAPSAESLIDGEILNSIDEYYQDCYDKMLEGGIGTVEFENIVSGDLYKELTQIYNSGTGNVGYTERALIDMGAGSCQISIQPEVLAGGCYRMNHTIAIK